MQSFIPRSVRLSPWPTPARTSGDSLFLVGRGPTESRFDARRTNRGADPAPLPPNNRFIALSKFPEVDTLKASWLLWSNSLGKLGFDRTLVP